MAQFGGPSLREREDGYKEKVVSVNKVSKTVKGGRIFKFAALVVVGDGKGKVGFGIGKAAEVSGAVKKGIDEAKKNLVEVSLRKSGGAVRAIVEVLGIKDIRTKALRSNNPYNVVRATMKALRALRTADEIATIRGKLVKEILY